MHAVFLRAHCLHGRDLSASLRVQLCFYFSFLRNPNDTISGSQFAASRKDETRSPLLCQMALIPLVLFLNYMCSRLAWLRSSQNFMRALLKTSFLRVISHPISLSWDPAMTTQLLFYWFLRLTISYLRPQLPTSQLTEASYRTSLFTDIAPNCQLATTLPIEGAWSFRFSSTLPRSRICTGGLESASQR